MFKDALNRYNEFVKKNKREPLYVMIMGQKATANDFKDAKLRFERFIRHEKRLPQYVEVKLGPIGGVAEVEIRNPNLKPLRDYFGDFRTATEWYKAIQGKGEYDYYYNDVYSLKTEIERVTHGAGLNCTDWSQLTAAVLHALKEEGKNYKVTFLHVKCFSRKLNCYALGHVLLEVEGEEFKKPTIMDPAAAANSGKPLGETMCLLGYRVCSRNPSWLNPENL